MPCLTDEVEGRSMCRIKVCISRPLQCKLFVVAASDIGMRSHQLEETREKGLVGSSAGSGTDQNPEDHLPLLL